MNTSSARVIKPPIKQITTGKIFKPSSIFRNKMWLNQFLGAFILWLISYGSSAGILYLILIEEPLTPLIFASLWNDWTFALNFWITIFNLIWLIPALILTPYYVRSIEYSVISETGESIPEIYAKKGIFRITRKHVPFRTITNISSFAGPIDRVLGIGNVTIETAGYSGQKMGPEQKLEGFTFYEEIRDLILNELRKYQQSYTTTTGVTEGIRKVQTEGSNLEDPESIRLLREIRDLLKK